MNGNHGYTISFFMCSKKWKYEATKKIFIPSLTFIFCVENERVLEIDGMSICFSTQSDPFVYSF